nr:hypothetical protein BaRGS_023178 [Batillaria attramentaria]
MPATGIVHLVVVAEAGIGVVVVVVAVAKATDDALDESMKDIKLENTEGDSQYGTENRKEGQGTGTAEDDGEADSDAEFAAEDDRKGQSGDMKWQWHIELYPIAYEDMQLENFTKMHKTASHCQMMFTEQASGPAKGEAHFYTDKLVAAKTIIRNLCCKKFQHQRPFVYISKRRNQSSSEFETAVLRLDLAEAAKMRWDKQRKTTEGVSRTSLKGLLLGYRRVTIGNQLLDIKPLSTEEIDANGTRTGHGVKRHLPEDDSLALEECHVEEDTNFCIMVVFKNRTVKTGQ